MLDAYTGLRCYAAIGTWACARRIVLSASLLSVTGCAPSQPANSHAGLQGLEMRCRDGSQLACSQLVEIYENGEGVPKNPERAAKLRLYAASLVRDSTAPPVRSAKVEPAHAEPSVTVTTKVWEDRKRRDEPGDPLLVEAFSSRKADVAAAIERVQSCKRQCPETPECRIGSANCPRGSRNPQCEQSCEIQLERELSQLAWIASGAKQCAATLALKDCITPHRMFRALGIRSCGSHREATCRPEAHVGGYSASLSTTALDPDAATLLRSVRDHFLADALKTSWASEVEVRVMKDKSGCSEICRNLVNHTVPCSSAAAFTSRTWCSRAVTVEIQNRGSAERSCRLRLAGTPLLAEPRRVPVPGGKTVAVRETGTEEKVSPRLRVYCADERAPMEALGVSAEEIELLDTASAAPTVSAGVAFRENESGQLGLAEVRLFTAANVNGAGWLD